MFGRATVSNERFATVSDTCTGAPKVDLDLTRGVPWWYVQSVGEGSP